MKKYIFLFALVAATLSNVAAQDAAAIVKHYNRVTGLDKLTEAEAQNVRMDLSIEAQGMEIPMTVVGSLPDKFRVEMEMMGSSFLAVINGGKGWMQIPGQGTMEMPEELMSQFTQQTEVSHNHRWSDQDYTFELADKKTVDGVELQGVRATAKTPAGTSCIVYFNPSTHLAVLIDSIKAPEGVMDQEAAQAVAHSSVLLKEYKDFGKYKLPSVMEIDTGTDAGTIIMKISNFEYGFAAQPWMFAQPE